MDKIFFENNNVKLLGKIINQNVYNELNIQIQDLNQDSINIINEIINNEMKKILLNNKHLINKRDKNTLTNINKKTLQICIPEVINFIRNIQNENKKNENKKIKEDFIQNKMQDPRDLMPSNDNSMYNDLQEQFIINNSNIEEEENINFNDKYNELINSRSNIQNQIIENNPNNIQNQIIENNPNNIQKEEMLGNEYILDNDNLESNYVNFVNERNNLEKIEKGNPIKQIKDEPNDKLINTNYEKLISNRNKIPDNNDINISNNELIIYSSNRNWIEDNTIHSFNTNLNLSLLKSIQLNYIIFPKRNYNHLNKIKYDQIFKYPYLLLKLKDIDNNIYLHNDRYYSKLILKNENDDFIYYHNESEYITTINSIDDFSIELLKPNGNNIKYNDKYKLNKFNIKNNCLIVNIKNHNFILYDRVKINNNDIKLDDEYRIIEINNDKITIDLDNDYEDKEYNNEINILNLDLQISYHFKLVVYS